MENTNKLPENWVIDTEKEKDSPLMPKFVEWFKNMDEFAPNYRLKGIKNGVPCYRSFANQYNVKLITLEQWNEAYFPEWQPKHGERVLVRKNGDNWFERVFILKYNNFYFCEKLNCTDELLGFCEIKQLPKESQLQPKIDELKSEAERLGLKIEIIIS